MGDSRMAAEPISLHDLDKRVSALQQWRENLQETINLKIENAVNKAVIKLLLGAAGLLAIQSLLETIWKG
jgi:hypothetical protein